MRLTKFIGRILLAILFVNAGFSHFLNQDSYIHYFNIRYPIFYQYAKSIPFIESSLTQFEQLQPTNFIKYTPQLIQALGFTQILFGFGVGLGIQKAGYLLAFLTVFITIYAHNPLIYSKQVDIEREYIQIIFNVGIIGALFLVHKNKNNNKNKDTQISCSSTSTQELKKTEQAKQKNSETAKQDDSKKPKAKAQ
ncbi:unnamed protein product [Paramecium sonneborni]|uniref:Uncharacterized protein n=1 Tax=Paramecium sonneborni TaxID=65129 RepID=A0A8S1MYY1_9CILI|nr:unnamed protein product [Paramecium sonneborni]